jgi:small subunit ribosomal protein S1
MAKKTTDNDNLFGDGGETTSNLKIQNDDFAKMFESSSGGGSKLRVGDTFQGEILAINKDEAFVSTATTQDAVMMVSDLLNEDKTFKFNKGDMIDVTVVAVKGGEIRVSRTGSKKAHAGLDSLEDAHDMELPVEGRVIEPCNGGFKVQIENKVAFCPISQMDYKVGEASQYVNKKFEFLITQFDPKGRNLVVSRRKVLDLQKAENEGDFMQKTKVDDIVSGEITRMEKFGAFVRIDGGVEGLCHISEIGWSRLNDPSEVLSLGQKVQVKILGIAEVDGRLKISLSIKQGGGESDPWTMVTEKFPVGSQWDGTVEKKENYGLFVNVSPGITGLLPRSKWRDAMDPSQYENKKKGDKIKVQIDEILFEQHKISMGLPVDAEDSSWRTHAAAQPAKKSGFNTSLQGLNDLLKKK